MASSDEQALGDFEKKILRWKQELYDKYDDIDVVKRIYQRWVSEIGAKL